MSTELEVFTAYDRPPSLTQLQAGMERLCGVKVVFEKKKEEPETEWTWAHFFQASSPDTGGFSIDRVVVNRKMRETLEGLEAPTEFVRGINWCYTLSAPEGTEQKELEMMVAAAGVLAKFTRGKVYDPQEEAVLEADEVAGSVGALAKRRELLPEGGSGAAARLARAAPPWLSMAIAVGVLLVIGAVIYFILSHLVLILAILGAAVAAVVGYKVWKQEQENASRRK